MNSAQCFRRFPELLDSSRSPLFAQLDTYLKVLKVPDLSPKMPVQTRAQIVEKS